MPGLCGAALFAVLTAWTVLVNPTVFGAVGGGSGSNTTFTTSTTTHTACGDPSTPPQMTVTSTHVFGPQTILIGDNQSQTFFVQAGTDNINTNTDTALFSLSSCHVAPALSLGALAVCAVVLAAYAVRRVSQHAAAGAHRPTS